MSRSHKRLIQFSKYGAIFARFLARFLAGL
nr:MAG TPA: hypothetical protein [Caudoviricetes sp.]